MLPRHARCVLSRLRCNGHSLLLGSYLSRIGRIENSSCSACGHSSPDVSHLILHCPATDSLRRSLFGDSLSLYDLWCRPCRVARLLGLHGLPLCPHPLEGLGNNNNKFASPQSDWATTTGTLLGPTSPPLTCQIKMEVSRSAYCANVLDGFCSSRLLSRRASSR